MSEYVDVAIIENGKIIGSFKALHKTEEKAEKKDEIKNKISMALKDPILQQGFEIICKNLAELEKENEETSRKANEAIADKLLVTAKFNEILNNLNQENDNLKKENAELKKWQKDTIKARGDDYMDWSRMKDQFTEAKKLLEKWVELFKVNDKYALPIPIWVKTEQFLNGGEK